MVNQVGQKIPLEGYIRAPLETPRVQEVKEVSPLAYPKTTTVRSTTSSSATIYTTPSLTDFYLSQVIISGTITGGGSSPWTVAGITGIRAYVNGILTYVGSIALCANLYSPDGGSSLMNTSQSGTISIQFKNPIKIDRNTAISSAVVSGSGPSSFLAVIYGFDSEDSKE